MRSSTERINIAASARKLDVDNRISLRYYYRIADNILKQADIFRAEKNIIDLYIMLLRFSSLVSETITCHRDYGASLRNQKVYFKKRLVNALTELEDLKPQVLQKINELNRRYTYQINSVPQSAVKNQNLTYYGVTKAVRPAARELGYYGSRTQQISYSRPMEEQFQRMSLNLLRPKEETLSKHSILGPNGLYGQWQPPRSDRGVKYPSNVDLTPVEFPSLQQPTENEFPGKNDHSNSEPVASSFESTLTVDHVDREKSHVDEPCPMISFEEPETSPDHNDITRQLSPPPVLAEVQDLVATHSSKTDCTIENPSADGLVHSESPLELHIATTMMESFMKLAKSNTDRNLETCGILAGSLKNRKFYVTALIIPKQESTSNTCQATNEEEIFEVQDKKSLFPLGWIHTHPTQSCFMSSVDVHTHYSYQIMLPEAVAIVMAPTDTKRKHGIFRLTTPGGMSVIRQCQQRGFHSHNSPPDGGSIYDSCTDVYMNPSVKFEVIDLR
ncbi:associated molecule with the SH3 domain of STAM 1 [Hibiscus trionum]|uniref:Associated molecule with the SH3 domain of STAM 1 n=1 Tax=Hibiscus trionum TaxID=183268 RepID=A0A9W7H6F3_HIBTR|nr:associated molecule with the SH3 domain of STAM 1 [Hibiscus trionum]